MISIALREHERNEKHTTIGVYIGPDQEHRGLAGVLTMTEPEWDELRKHLIDDEVMAPVEKWREVGFPGIARTFGP